MRALRAGNALGLFFLGHKLSAQPSQLTRLASKMSSGAPFRNPHNLPVKDCVTCGRPFTWRKKWEKCWDEVLTCSNRCKTERKSASKNKQGSGGGSAAVAAGAAGLAASRRAVKADEDEDEDEEDEALPLTTRKKASGLPLPAIDDEEDEEGSEEQAEVDPRRLRRQAAKAERRARRALSPQEKAEAKRKACSLCEKRVDLLVRCRIDASATWHMLCGRCWKDASGGVPDGDAEHPHYRYGGLWKNRSAKVATPKFGAKARERSQDNTGGDLDEEAAQALDAAYKGG